MIGRERPTFGDLKAAGELADCRGMWVWMGKSRLTAEQMRMVTEGRGLVREIHFCGGYGIDELVQVGASIRLFVLLCLIPPPSFSTSPPESPACGGPCRGSLLTSATGLLPLARGERQPAWTV